MNKLPPELHNYICESACAEDASGILALSMVSTYFHELSKPYLYRNIAISGVHRVSALSERLAIIPPHLCRIHHLFLSDVPKLDGQTTSTIPHSHTEDSRKILRSVVQILAYASPTLRSLSVFSESPISTALIARVFRTFFPVLRRLSIHGFYPFFSSPGRFPRLEFLHLSGSRNPTGLLQVWTLEDACPTLKTLQITGLNSAGSFVAEVEDALKSTGADSHHTPDSIDCLASSRFPPQLETLMVQAGPAPDHALGKVVSLKDNIMMDGLECLRNGRTDRHSVHVYVPERTLRSLSVEDMRNEWVAGIFL